MPGLFQNLSAHPGFEDVLSRLQPAASLVEWLVADRRILALVAVGSVPGGYALPDSDLDLFAFLEGPPARVHYLSRGKISLREFSFDRAYQELETSPEVSMLPLALGAQSSAVIYASTSGQSEILSALAALRQAAAACLFKRVEGEISWGLRRRQPALASRWEGWAGITPQAAAGYHLVTASLFNPILAGKLERMSARGNLAPDLAGRWLRITPETVQISYSDYARLVVRASRRWYLHTLEKQTITARQGWRLYYRSGQRVHEPMPERYMPAWRWLWVPFRSAWKTIQPGIRRRYGRLAPSSDRWLYDGIGQSIFQTPVELNVIV